ncbi:MAG: peptidoglycan-binding domain-containing protein [Alphaproteobacteria bacterium]
MRDALDLLTLHAPAGNGQVNDPADIAALDASLRRIEAYTPPPEYAAEPQRYPTAPLIRALESFQERNGLKIDGYADPGGPTERAINNRLLAKPRGAGLLFDPPAPLAGTVGNGFDNRPADVAAVQRLLGATGDLPEDPFDRPRGFIDENTTRAIESFQRRTGLADDGWLAPNGETERALHAAVADLARANGRDWLAFAERAGRAQARMSLPYSARGRIPLPGESESAVTVPVAWPGPTADDSRPRPPPSAATSPDDGDARIEPAQTTPGDWIVPFVFLTLPGLLGLGESNRQRVERQRTGDDDTGGKTEFIPPRADDRPYRGSDPARPPLDPKLTRPSPSPGEPPLKLPDREEIRPETLKPQDWTIVTPAIRPFAASDLALLNRGNLRTQGRLVQLRELGEAVAKERSDIALIHIGGARQQDGSKVTEYYAANPRRKELGIKTIAGSAFADLTFWDPVANRLYHISLYRVTSGTKPLKEELEQSISLAANKIGETELIVMVPNVRGDDFVDGELFKRFLHATLDSLRGAPEVTEMSDAASRDRVIRYFTEIGLR